LDLEEVGGLLAVGLQFLQDGLDDRLLFGGVDGGEVVARDRVDGLPLGLLQAGGGDGDAEGGLLTPDGQFATDEGNDAEVVQGLLLRLGGGRAGAGGGQGGLLPQSLADALLQGERLGRGVGRRGRRQGGRGRVRGGGLGTAAGGRGPEAG